MAELVGEITSYLVLWVRIIGNRLRKFANHSEMFRYLETFDISSMRKEANQHNANILLNFEEVRVDLRRICYAIVSFGEAQIVEISDVAAFLGLPIEEAWHLVKELSRESLVRFTEIDNDKYHGNVNIHGVLFESMLNFAATAESDQQLTRFVDGLNLMAMETARKDEQIFFNFLSLDDDFLLRIIDSRRIFLMQKTVDCLLSRANSNELIETLFGAKSWSGETALFKLFQTTDWVSNNHNSSRTENDTNENGQNQTSPLVGLEFNLKLFVQVLNRLLENNYNDSDKAIGRLFPVEQFITHLIDHQSDQIGNVASAAAILNCTKVLQLLFKSTFKELIDIVVDQRGNTCLHLSIELGHLESSKALIEMGANPTIANCDGKIAMVEAANVVFGDRLLKPLLTQSAFSHSINSKDGDGVSAIVATILHYPPNKCGFDLLINDDSVDISTMSNSASISCVDLCQNLGLEDMAGKLLSKHRIKSIPDTSENVRRCSQMLQLKFHGIKWPSEGLKGLYDSIFADIENIQWEDPNDSDPMSSSTAKRMKMETSSKHVELALWTGAWFRKLNAVKQLHRFEPEILMATTSSRSQNLAIHLASLRDFCDVTRFLIHHTVESKGHQQSNKMVPDRFGFTPLHYCCRGKSVRTLRFLLSEVKCDVNAQAQGAISILHEACRYDSAEILNVLFDGQDQYQFHIDVNTIDFQGRTPLMTAVAYGNIDCVRALLKSTAQGPNLQIVDKAGKTVLDIAQQNGRQDLVNMLNQYRPN